MITSQICCGDARKQKKKKNSNKKDAETVNIKENVIEVEENIIDQWQ